MAREYVGCLWALIASSSWTCRHRSRTTNAQMHDRRAQNKACVSRANYVSSLTNHALIFSYLILVLPLFIIPTRWGKTAKETFWTLNVFWNFSVYILCPVPLFLKACRTWHAHLEVYGIVKNLIVGLSLSIQPVMKLKIKRLVVPFSV